MKKKEIKVPGKVIDGEESRIGWGWMDVAVIAGLVIYAAAVWWPTQELLYWGEMQDWLVVATEELLSRGLAPWALVEWQTAMPPGFSSVLIGFWQWGGQLAGSHRMMLVGMLVLLIGMYGLGRKLAGRLAGTVAAFLVGWSPLTVAVMGWISPYLWASGWWVAGGWVWQEKKSWVAIVLFSVGALTIPSTLWLLVVFWWWEKQKTNQWLGRGAKKLLVPIAVYLVYLVYHNWALGWWLVPPGAKLQMPTDVGEWLVYVAFVAQVSLGWHLRLLAIIPAVAVGVWLIRDKRMGSWAKKFGGVVLASLAMAGYWGFRGGFEEEMVIIIFPWLMLATVELWSMGIKKISDDGSNIYLILMAGVIGIAWLTQWRPDIQPESSFNLRRPADLSYQDRVFVNKQMAAYLEYTQSEAKIYGGSPEAAQLGLPQLGYVGKTLDFEWCSNFKLEPERRQVVVFHPYHVSQVECREVLEKSANELMQRYESNGRWVEVYRVFSVEES